MLTPLVTLLLASAPTVAAAPAIPPAECPAWGAKPAGCAEPPLRDQIKIFGSWSAEVEAEQAAAGMIRGPISTLDFDAAIPLDGFPAALHRGENETSAQVELRMVIGPDDAVLDCRITSVKGFESASMANKSAELAIDPAIGSEACRLVKTTGRFRHGLDGDGRPVVAPLQMLVIFQRQRRDRSFPPAPSPPSRWIGKRPYDRETGWPPNLSGQYPANPVHFAAPRWKDFVADRKDLPKAAMVGVLLDFDRTGTMTACRIGQPSDDPALDAATCRALAAVRNEVRFGWDVRGYPVEVHWKKHKAELVFPVKPAPPALIAPVPIAEADIPAAALPKYPVQLQIQVDPSGQALSCRILYPRNNPDAIDARSCALVLQRARFAGGRDAFGGGAIGGLYVDVDWTKRTIEAKQGYF